MPNIEDIISEILSAAGTERQERFSPKRTAENLLAIFATLNTEQTFARGQILREISKTGYLKDEVKDLPFLFFRYLEHDKAIFMDPEDIKPIGIPNCLIMVWHEDLNRSYFRYHNTELLEAYGEITTEVNIPVEQRVHTDAPLN